MKTPSLHFQRIDTLRGVAIAMVFLFHYLLAVDQRNVHLSSAAANVPDYLKPLLHVYALGLLGVPLFFVISGFCIQCSFLSWRAKHADRRARDYLPHFFQRRFWRIVPPYLLALVALYFLKTPEPWSAFELKKLAAHALLINTLVPGLFFHLNSSFWSICVEWQLYLIFPLFLLLSLRFDAWVSLVISAFTTLCFQLFLSSPSVPTYLANLPFRWWFDWVIGAYLATAYVRKQRIFPAHWIVPVALGIATYLSIIWLQSAELKRILPPFFFAALVERAVWSKKPLTRIEKVVGNLGQCSYSFYLLHQPATYLLVGLVALPVARMGPLTIWLGLAVVILSLLWAVSWFGYRWIEKPAVQIGERLSRRSARKTALAQPEVTAANQPQALESPTQSAV